jgi:hypothetical protein
VFFTASLTDEQKRGYHPLKGLNVCRSCRTSSKFIESAFINCQWAIPTELKPIQCYRCHSYNTKPFFVRKTDDQLFDRYLCTDCTAHGDIRIGIEKSDGRLVQVHGPQLHPDHPHIAGIPP